ncbi:MAG: hypothetical protein AB8B87_23385 [Granulosicoccus sp.]
MGFLLSGYGCDAACRNHTTSFRILPLSGAAHFREGHQGYPAVELAAKFHLECEEVTALA